jgi:hypothetical protein
VERDDPKGKAVVHIRPERGKEECYRRGGRCHYAVVCPTREQKFTMICGEAEPQAEADKSQPAPILHEDHNVEAQEEVLECSTLPLCVIRRVLTG